MFALALPKNYQDLEFITSRKVMARPAYNVPYFFVNFSAKICQKLD